MTKAQAPAADLARRALLLVCLIVAAALCVFSAGDRLANLPGHAPSRLSPSWFGAGDARQAALRALDRRDFAAALKWAKRVVARDPAGTHSSGLLGVSLLGVGQPVAAQQAYTVAAATGWRDEGVQTYWLMTSLALGDVKVAAERLDALLRTDNRDDATLVGLRDLESTPEGRAAVATRLALGPDWGNWYALSLRTIEDARFGKRLEVMRLAQRQGYRFDPDVIAPIASFLQRKGRIADAAQVWRSFSHDGENAGRSLIDGGFEHLGDGKPTNPFDWVLLENALIDAKIDGAPPTGSGAALYVNSTATTERRAAQQALLLSPGAYVLRWAAATGNGERSSDVTANVACGGSGQLLTASSAPIGRIGNAAPFTIPQSGCAAQIVSIDAHARPAATREPTWIDNVSIVAR